MYRTTGDKILAVSGNEQIKMAENAITTADGFSFVKDQVNNFVENSKVLVSALDEVGKLHPFIQGRFLVWLSFDWLANSLCPIQRPSYSSKPPFNSNSPVARMMKRCWH